MGICAPSALHCPYIEPRMSPYEQYAADRKTHLMGTGIYFNVQEH
jgi:hypothetical protein